MTDAVLPPGWPAMSIEQAHAILTGPGMPTETDDAGAKKMAATTGASSHVTPRFPNSTESVDWSMRAINWASMAAGSILMQLGSLATVAARAHSASAINARWQRHQTASAHRIAVRAREARASSFSSPRANSSLDM